MFPGQQNWQEGALGRADCTTRFSGVHFTLNIFVLILLLLFCGPLFLTGQDVGSDLTFTF